MVRSSYLPFHLGLSGKAEEKRLSYVLSPGINRLGSARSNDFVLPPGGVSRCHALIYAGASGLRLEDLASKNGTRVNGRRVQEATLSPGDEIELGNVRLRLHELERDDAELAVTLPRAEAPSPTPRPRDTSTYPPGPQPASLWLTVVERFVRSLAPRGDVSAALDILVTDLRVAGAAFVELPEGEDPVILAARGRSDLTWLDQGIAPVAREAPPDIPDDPADFTFLPAESEICVALRRSSGRDPRALLIVGDFDGRSESEVLLLTLLGLLDRACSPPASSGSGALGGLRFPAGYVRAVSPSMKELYREMRVLAQSGLSVLILGETGVGKEYLARILHESSERRRAPYLALNCAAIPSELLEAELFGIGKGVATGVAARRGKFHLCDGGTLFLDEIGDMPEDLQAKLLRVLQEKEITPVGGRPRKVDVRIVAATNTSLAEKMRRGTFRRDLYYRLAGFLLEVPPLRRRPEDIPGLVESFLRRCCAENGRSVRGLTVGAMRNLVAYPWPGNARELENEIGRLVCACPDGQPITRAMLAERIRDGREPENKAPVPVALEDPTPEASTGSAAASLETLNLAAAEKHLIRLALRRAGRNRTAAARMLGITRYALRRRMRWYGLLEGED